MNKTKLSRPATHSSGCKVHSMFAKPFPVKAPTAVVRRGNIATGNGLVSLRLVSCVGASPLASNLTSRTAKHARRVWHAATATDRNVLYVPTQQFSRRPRHGLPTPTDHHTEQDTYGADPITQPSACGGVPVLTSCSSTIPYSALRIYRTRILHYNDAVPNWRASAPPIFSSAASQGRMAGPPPELRAPAEFRLSSRREASSTSIARTDLPCVHCNSYLPPAFCVPMHHGACKAIRSLHTREEKVRPRNACMLARSPLGETDVRH